MRPGPSGCGRTLRRREHAQTCRGRDHTSPTVALRPRRASCVVEGHPRVAARCGPPAARMATTVIRTALPGSAGGDGYGRRSAEWGRPVSTVQPGVRSSAVVTWSGYAPGASRGSTPSTARCRHPDRVFSPARRLSLNRQRDGPEVQRPRTGRDLHVASRTSSSRARLSSPTSGSSTAGARSSGEPAGAVRASRARTRSARWTGGESRPPRPDGRRS